jgi:hypothetical protein
MKLRVYFAIILGLSLMFAACKDDNSVNPPGGGDTGNYFPNNDGAYYKYNLESQDSTGTKSGTRTTRYTGTATFSGQTYQQQTDTVIAGGETGAGVTYFRKTETDVLFHVDTTGLGNTIPDSIMQYISMDAHFRIMQFPLNETQAWDVFKMTLTYGITLNVIEVTANVAGKENITLNLETGNENKEAYKIKYTFILRMPDPQNPFNTLTETFEAHAWAVSGIGIVRWQGSAAIVAAFTGGGIDIDEGTTVMTQNLIEYRLN